MKILVLSLVAGVVLMGVISAYVRLAPISLQAVTQDYTQDTDLVGGFVAVRPFEGEAAQVLARAVQVALATPRTTQVEPLIFVTRSRGFGFPDVTQVTAKDGMLTVHAQLVYGKADLGVNKARVLAWLAALGPL